MKALATYSIKGGVGKTTAAVNLAHEASGQGARVLLWDLDPQGAATYFFRIRPRVKGGAERLVGRRGALEPHVRATDRPGLHVVPSDFSLRHLDLHLDASERPVERIAALLAALGHTYDVVVLDCAPGVTLASESVFAAVDALVVPVIPTTLSARTLDQLDAFIGGRNRPQVWPFFSMVDRRKRLQRELQAELADSRPFLATAIPNASAVERMAVERAPVSTFAAGTPAATAFASLWGEIASRLWD